MRCYPQARLSERFFLLARRREIWSAERTPVREHSKFPNNAASGKKIRLIICYVFYETHHVTSVTVFIIVPRNNFNECAV